MDEKSEKLIQATIEYMYLPDVNVEVDFSHSILLNDSDMDNTNKQNKQHNTFCVYMDSEKDKNDYLDFINNYLSKSHDNEDRNNDISYYANHLLAFAEEHFLDCRFAIDKNDMMFCFNRPGHIQVFDENCKSLDDVIAGIIETGNLSLEPFKCNETSLEEFISIIHSNSFERHDTIQR